MTEALTTRRRYTPQEIDQALLVLAGTGGILTRASEITEIPISTLHLWRQKHLDRYLQLAEQERPKLEAIATELAASALVRTGQLEHRVIEKLDTMLDDQDTKTKELAEVAGTLQRVTTSKGINGTKLLELTGRPTQITEHRDGTQILQELKRIAPSLIVDSTAEEVPTTALLQESGSPNARTGGPSV